MSKILVGNDKNMVKEMSKYKLVKIRICLTECLKY